MSLSQRQLKPLNGDWQATMYTTLDRTKYLLQTGLLADCEFLVGDYDERKELIKANRTILAMNSPVFETQFFGTDVPQPQPILIPDMQPETFKNFLKFIYTETTNITSLEQAENLSYAASKYILPTLFRICVEYMSDHLSPETVFRALEFGIFHDESNLKENCFRMLSQQMRASLTHSSTDFEDIDESTLLFIVKMEILDITEVELFDAVKLWAGRQCLKSGLGITGVNMRKMLGKMIISHIRFLAMTPEEFATSPACSGILTNEECLSVFMNLNSRVHFIMPIQLSLSRNRRQEVETRKRRYVYGDERDDTRPRPSSDRSSKENDDMNHVSLLLSPSFLSTNEKIYCLRRIVDEIVVHNQGNLDCSVTLTVDQKIRIQGIVISSQISERPDGHPSSGRYTEMGLHYCHLLDPDGTRLTYRHFAGHCSRVRQPPTLDVLFNRPIIMEKNRAYKICLLLNRHGSAYSLGTASGCNIFYGVRFQFGPPSVRDGIIRGVIFDLV